MKMAQTTTVQETEDTNSAAFIEFLTETPGLRGSQGEEMGVRGETGSYSWIISITNDHHPFCFLCYAKTISAVSMHARKYVSKKLDLKAIGTRTTLLFSLTLNSIHNTKGVNITSLHYINFIDVSENIL